MQSFDQSSANFFGEIENINILSLKIPSHNFCTFDDNIIESMANSIRQHGLLQPLVVRTKDDHFEIVARMVLGI